MISLGKKLIDIQKQRNLLCVTLLTLTRQECIFQNAEGQISIFIATRLWSQYERNPVTTIYPMWILFVTIFFSNILYLFFFLLCSKDWKQISFGQFCFPVFLVLVKVYSSIFDYIKTIYRKYSILCTVY